MFRIYDGREHFYQWDIDRQLAVADRSIVQVHFCNRTGDCALVCECYELDGNWVANVPNILLQDSWRLRVYAYDGNATRFDACFDIKARTKPDTYVYTETEVLTFERLEAEIDSIKNDIGQAVADYFEENPIDVDLTGYATEKYVDDAISAIELTPGPQGEQGIPGNDGKDGKDGQPGEPGKDGQDGKDGYTPIKGVDYFDGQDGKDGQNGQDGKTPVKGTDYWTAEDRAAMVADVVAALPVYNGEVV